MSLNGSGNVNNGGGENGRPAAAAGNARVGGGSVALPAIEKLRGRENYTTWAFAMRMILIREGCWEAVNAETDEAQAAVPDDLKQRALATICLSLETYNYSLVLDATDARAAWKKLQTAFQDSGLNRKIGLLRKFTSIRLVNRPSVEAYVDELMSTSHKLSMGFKVDDSWLAAMLLIGLEFLYTVRPKCIVCIARGANHSIHTTRKNLLLIYTQP